MSVVTNVVLVTGLMDEPQVEEINQWLYDNGFGSVVRVDQHAGGSKVMEVNVYLGAFNYLDESSFVEFAQTRNWRWPEEFSLFVQTEDRPSRIFQNTDRTQRDREAAES